MEESLSQESLSFVQRVLDEILEQPVNFVHSIGCGLLMVKFKVGDTGYEIVFDENVEVQRELTYAGKNIKESGEFYKLESGCSFSVRAPEGWIFLHLFKRKADAVGSTSTSVGSDQCGEGS